ncbi:MAG: response regulator [Fluviicola sp.]
METKNLRILIVDDDLFLQQMLCQQFQNEGIHQILTASSEKECLDALDSCDIILLDYYLNDENGIDILRKIKARNSNIPVIFLSGQEFVNIAIRSLKY